MSEEVSALPKLDSTDPSVPKESSDDSKPRRPLPALQLENANESLPKISEPISSTSPTKHAKSPSFAPPTPSSATKPNRKTTVGTVDQPILPSPSAKPAKAASVSSDLAASPIKNETIATPEVPIVPAPTTPEQPNNSKKDAAANETEAAKLIPREPQPPLELRPQTGSAKSRVMSFLKTGSFAILKKNDSDSSSGNILDLEKEKRKNRMSLFGPKKDKSEKAVISSPVAATVPDGQMLATAQNIPNNGTIPTTSVEPRLSKVDVKPIRAGSVFISSDQNKKNMKDIERLESQVKVLSRIVTGLVKDNKDLRDRIRKNGEKIEMSKSLESLVNHGFQEAIEELNGTLKTSTSNNPVDAGASSIPALRISEEASKTHASPETGIQTASDVPESVSSAQAQVL